MPDKITIEYNGTAIIGALKRLQEGMSPAGLRSPLSEIGELVKESVERRFVTSTAPDGTRWAPNAQSTYLGLLGKRDLRKNGRINARGSDRVANKRPLVQRGQLAESFHYQLIPGGVEIGTNDIRAGTHQFGARKGAYGKSKRGGPIPWGDIPARPFLGLSTADEAGVLGILESYLEQLAGN